VIYHDIIMIYIYVWIYGIFLISLLNGTLVISWIYSWEFIFNEVNYLPSGWYLWFVCRSLAANMVI
jgi:hypothetical protein